ncbi:undecaprenyl-diphosphatase [Nocardia amikacinitolerans]|uniref:phosphatase PAP2 family protein n=1 Tax=Nocardia amikacinitolerans TaxID=756689 RepID=UPI0020A23F6A|nr:phosphatase PAP2 family protein [Nocardia amikacinitolerans]MCP2293933.1 undecaprenyl-diphosphatase [Nocardia amikacinitolerans]
MDERRISGAVRAYTGVLCAVIALTIPLSFPADGGRTDLDRAVEEPVRATLDGYRGVYHVLVVPSNAYILLPLLFAATAWFAYRREWWRAATMFVVPEVAVAINTLVLKPLWDRPLHDYLAYPSGHTVHLVAIAATFVLLTDSTGARRTVAVVTVVALGGVAVGMIGLDYHLATDVLGGAAAAIAMVIALCAITDPLARAVSGDARGADRTASDQLRS